jgi:hypothetical protein
MKKLIEISAIIGTLVLLVAVTAAPSASANTPGIRVTVRDSNRDPIPNALVQFVLSTNPASEVVNTFRADMMGVAMYANAPAGTYGINVTHPDFASTSVTSLQTTLGTNELQLGHNNNDSAQLPFSQFKLGTYTGKYGHCIKPYIPSLFGIWVEGMV